MTHPTPAPKHRLAASLIAVLICLISLGPCSADRLASGFRNPPNSAKPWVWWHWMNGNISREGIKADLEAMNRVGIGGAQIFNVDCGIPHGPIQYMSPEWRGLFKYAVEQASQLGIELGMHNSAGWSSSGGPWVQPEQGQQELVWTETSVTGPSTFSKKLDQPATRRGFYRDVAVFAIKNDAPAGGDRADRIWWLNGRHRGDWMEPDTSAAPAGMAIPQADVLDISSKLTPDGTINWDVPEGKWTVLRMGHTVIETYNTPAPPEGTGLECDKMSKNGIDSFWAGGMAPILSDIGPLAGKTLTNCLVDSFERGGQNWTSLMREEFTKRRGYDPMPYLPAITGRVIESLEVTDRFLWDWRRTIADLHADNYFGRFAELCHQSGMNAAIEPYGDGAFDNLQIGTHADMPMGEFWTGGGLTWGVKLASSLAHTSGHSVAGTESFTADGNTGRWLVTPAQIKSQGDAVYCMGINRFIFHRYAHQPWMTVSPGMTMGPWGFNMERTNTWWDQSKAWLSYLSRCQYMLQSGLFAADVCYYLGENAPLDMPARDQLRPAMPTGYDYDACSADTLMRMSVKRGRLVLPSGMSYKVLCLPESRFMTLRVARKIRDLVRSGAVVLGPRPEKSPSLTDYPQCDQELKALADEIWGDCDGASVKEHVLGKGRVVWGKPLGELLKDCGLREDFAATPGDQLVEPLYIHRKVGSTDVYFVSNQEDAGRSIECTFRVSGKVPELWNAQTGKIAPAPVYEEKDGRTTVPLRFEQSGSVFVVFRSKLDIPNHLVSVTAPASVNKNEIAVVKAVYESQSSEGGSADVTREVQRVISRGKSQFMVSNDLFGDPAVQHTKRLVIDYTIGGIAKRKIVQENAVANLADYSQSLDYELEAGPGGRLSVKAWAPGAYTLRTDSGETLKLTADTGARRTELTGLWDLSFPPNQGAPAAVELDRLISWSEHADPGVRYFSGTATYSTSFDAPARTGGAGDRAYYLDLGDVRNFAEVTLNGKNLGCLWKTPFRVDVTGILKPKDNKLVVRVTNLWINRLIGDEQFPEDCQWNSDGSIAKIPDWVTSGGPRPEPRRLTFTTWKYYAKDSPLLESGLIGPACLWEVPILTASPSP